MEKSGRLLVERPKSFLLAVAALVLLILGHFHTYPFCQSPHRVRVAHALHFHLEVDDTAALVAAKTVVDTLVGGYGEGCGLLSMEGTQAEHIGTGTLQAHILPDHIFNWIACYQFIDKRRGKRHVLSLLCYN